MSRFRISRRTALKGIGAAITLPLFEQMTWGDEPKKGKAGRSPVRMAYIYVPNGIVMDHFWPANPKELPKSLTSLKDLIADIIVLRGLDNNIANAEKDGKGGGGHAKPTAAWLTSAIPYRAGAINKVGISVDQLAASRIGHLTPLQSLELGTQGGGQGSDCDTGFNCSYTANISWRSASSPQAKETKPKQVFERLFTDARQGRNAQQQAQDAMLKTSVLDLVMEDAAGLKNQLGASDQRKLDEYLDSVRDIEGRIQRAGERGEVELPPEAAALKAQLPDDRPEDFELHLRLMMDLMVLAFQTDSTRVCTFMTQNDTSGRAYPNLGVSGGHHDLSHHGKDAGKLESLQKINQYHIEQYAYLLTKLKAVSEGKGTLLDNCMVAYGTPISDGDRHNPNDLPMLLAGRGGGSIRSGRPLRADGEKLANLHLALLQRMGVPEKSFGDSTKPLDLG